MSINLDNFETLLAYKCLTEEAYLASIVDHLQPVYFKNKDIQAIIGIITEFYNKRGCAPTTTEIKNYLTNDTLVAQFKNVVSSFVGIDKNLNRDELIENTETFLKERAIWRTLKGVTDHLTTADEIDTAKILHEFESSCNISLNYDLGLDLIPDIDRVIADLKMDNPYIKSGWKWLNEKLGGGFLENGRALYVFAGETNIGKSIFLGNIATAIAAQNKTVLLVTLEMSEMMYARRLCTNISKIPIATLRNDTDILKASMEGFGQKTPNSKILIKEFPPSTLSVNQLKAYIKKLANRGIKVDAVVVDYINLLHSSIGTNSYERVKHIAEQMRALSYIFNCPFITATQLNRCLDIKTKVITADNQQKRIDELRVGDKIKGSGVDVVVRYIYPQERQKCYKITTKSGKQVVCSERHLFPTVTGEVKSIQSGLKKGDKLMSLTESPE